METNIKSLLALSALLTMAGFIGSAVAGAYGVYFSLSVATLIPAASFWFAREAALFFMSAREVKIGEKPEGFDLNSMVETLCKEKEVNMPIMPLVCVMDSKTKNAFATGRSKSHAAIAITTGLLQEAKRHANGDMKKANRWIEAILLHELGHVVNGDIATKTVATVMTGSIRVFSKALYDQRIEKRKAQKNNKKDRNAIDDEPSFLRRAGEYIAFNWIIPYCGTLVGLCLSRTREFAADDMAAKCGRAQDMAEAFELLRSPGEKNHVHSVQMEAFASMMCASLNPEADQQRSDRLNAKDIGYFESFKLNLSNLTSTHPPLEARIARMKQAQTNASTSPICAQNKPA